MNLDVKNLAEYFFQNLRDLNQTSSLLDELTCSQMIEENARIYDENYCEAIWDGSFCWPATLPNQTAQVLCSDIFGDTYFHSNPNITAFRSCSDEGKWVGGLSYTNYTGCIQLMRLSIREALKVPDGKIPSFVPYFLFAGSTFSSFCLIVGILIYCSMKYLYADRFTIFLQLMITLLIKSILWIIIAAPEIFPQIFDYRELGPTCKIMVTLYFYIQLASTFWMVVLANYFNEKLNSVHIRAQIRNVHYYTFSWAFPLVILCIWVTAMKFRHEESACWLGYSHSYTKWIVTGPVLFGLGAIIYYLVRILHTAMTRTEERLSAGEKFRIRKAKLDVFTLFCLVGIHYSVLLCHPCGMDSEENYRLIQAIAHSLQGGMVTFLCCYVHRDVRKGIWMTLSHPTQERRIAIPFDC